jgi:hypothetical protein
MKQLPINFSTLIGKPLIFSGGGYFRLLPYSLIKIWTRQSDYVMSYLHPRDFDPNQPVIKELSMARKFKSYVGLKGTMAKLEQWLNDFDFIDITTAIKKIEWEKVPVVELTKEMGIKKLSQFSEGIIRVPALECLREIK